MGCNCSNECRDLTLPSGAKGDTGAAGTLPYLIYRALISQVATDPTVIVLENTIGTIVWTKTGTGIYAGTLTGAFTADKTFMLLQPNFITVPSHCSIYWVSANAIGMQTMDNTNALSDGLLTKTSLEILVYP